MHELSDRLSLPPEQQNTALLLSELLGKAVAAQYVDFCRLSMGMFALNVSKPMAAHALRELDSRLRGILAVPMDAVVSSRQQDEGRTIAVRTALKELGYGDAEVKKAIDVLTPRTSHKDQIRRILTQLGFEPNGDIADMWLGIVDMCQVAHGRSFHRRLEIDTDFILKLQQPFDVVIRSVMVALRGHYAALMRRVEALAAMPARSKAVNLFANEIPGAPQLQWHFFNKLTTSDWLGPLMGKGLLGEPARFEEIEGERKLYGEWPAGQYLLRMARDNDPVVRQQVVDVLRVLSEATHPDVVVDCIAILAALPSVEAAPLVELAVGWLARDVTTQYTLAPIDLLKSLAEKREKDAAIKFAYELFKVWGDEGRVKSHFREHMYEHHLLLLRPMLLRACGIDALKILIACLCQAMSIDGSGDYRRSSLNPIGQTMSIHGSIEEALVTAVRDTAVEIIRDRDATMGEVVEMLESNDLKIFTRLILHVLGQKPASAPDLSTTYLLRQDLITGEWCNQEYSTLAKAWFTSLSLDEQTRILEYVDAVPSLYVDSWSARIEKQQKTAPTAAEIKSFNIHCVQSLLWSWREVLPSNRRKAVESIGDPNAWRGRIEASDDSSPTTKDFFNNPIEETIAFLESWQSTSGPLRVTASALGQELRAAAIAQPEMFSSVAERFSGLRPIFVLRLLEGLQQAAANQKLIDWQNLLTLIMFVFEKSPLKVDDIVGAEDDVTTWGWARKAAGEIMMTGLRLGARGIGFKHREMVRLLVNNALAGC